MTVVDPLEDVVIIGAGLAGLTAAYTLKNHGIKTRILEKELHIAVSWRRRHPQLSLNTHRDLSCLPDESYPQGTGSFPQKNDVIAHLETFVRKHEIAIEYGVKVQNVTHHDEVFTIETTKGDIKARNVIIATGRDREPFTPNWTGIEDYQGQIIHASAFGAAQDYAKRSILVVGGGNSGFDVLNHLSRVPTSQIWFAVRTGPTVLPKRLKRFAVHRLSPLMARLPASVTDKLIAWTQSLAFGNLTCLGFPPSSHGAASRLTQDHIAIAVDDGAIKAIKANRITVVAGIERFQRNSVLLTDGTILEPDVIIMATGYSSGLETILKQLSVLNERGFLAPSGQEPLSRLKGLWFVGMTPSLISYFAKANTEAKCIAKILVKQKRS